MSTGTLTVDWSAKSQDQLNLYLRRELIKQAIKRLKAARSGIEQYMRFKVSRDFLFSSEANEIVYGVLRYDLGLKADEATTSLESIARLLAEDLHFTITASGDEVEAIVSFIKTDYSEILAIPTASFTSAKGNKIDWLKWLLYEGSEQIISRYHVAYVADGKAKASRSGGALMFHGGSFAIPSQFAGTPFDNFITRSFENIELYIQKKMLDAIV